MIGVARRRRDGDEKVRGVTRYVGDLDVPGLLHARPVLAAEAHARLLSISTDEALAVPGVVAVLTASDLPLAGGSGRVAEPLAREEIVWSGQPVALVIAESEAAAEDGAALVWAEEEPLEAVLDLEAAMASGAVPSRVTAVAGGGDGGAGAHGAGGSADESGAPDSPNVASFARLQRGDVDAELARADCVVSGRFRTNWIHQAYLEPQSTLAWVDPDGTLVVHSSTQGAYMARQGIAELLGLSLDRVRVQAAPLGGAFGGKLMISEPLAAAAAFKLRRPVRLVFQRSEDFAAANPAPGQLIDLELGVARDGSFCGIRGRIVGDRGGLGEMGVESISTALSTGPYRWAAHDLTSVGVTTNRVSAGAYRAPGAPPAAFAVETLIDRAAGELGLDPIELRLQNVLVAGDSGVDGAEIKSFGARECLDAVRRIRCGRRAGRCLPTRASASRSGSGRAGWSRRRRSASSTATAS